MRAGRSAVLRITYLDEDGLLTRQSPSRGRTRKADCACLPIPRAQICLRCDWQPREHPPAGRVADDARDATSKIPRPAAGDPLSTCSHRERDTEVGDICLTVVAWQGCSASLFVNLWSYSSNFTGCHPPTPSRRLSLPCRVKSHTPSSDGRQPCRATRFDDTPGLGRGMLYVYACKTKGPCHYVVLQCSSDPCARRFLPNPVTVLERDKRLPWAV